MEKNCNYIQDMICPFHNRLILILQNREVDCFFIYIVVQRMGIFKFNRMKHILTVLDAIGRAWLIRTR